MSRRDTAFKNKMCGWCKNYQGEILNRQTVFKFSQRILRFLCVNAIRNIMNQYFLLPSGIGKITNWTRLSNLGRTITWGELNSLIQNIFGERTGKSTSFPIEMVCISNGVVSIPSYIFSIKIYRTKVKYNTAETLLNIYSIKWDKITKVQLWKRTSFVDNKVRV